MDVRCEKCLTVYELDDVKVGDGGLTVKCQECGHLFKVRRRPDTAEMVARAPLPTTRGDAPGADPAATPPDAFSSGEITQNEGPPPVSSKRVTDDTAAASIVGRSRARAAGEPREERGWMLRSAATAEVLRFRELTTLQQWIVERKVTREDEISRGGDNWKKLGGIAELASFFHVVEQAEAVAHASRPGLAMQRSAADPRPLALADLPTEVAVRGARATGGFAEGGVSDTIVESLRDDEAPPRRRSVVPHLLVVAALAAGTLGGLWLWRERGKAASAANDGALLELARRGRGAFLTDTDDGFREAIAALERALEIGSTARGAALQARADLGEAHVTWAAYLVEDARRLEGAPGGPPPSAAGAQAARTLRAEAQAHLERARRVLEEPSAETAPPELARAFGDLLRVEGGPAAAAERYFTRATQQGASDPELAYARAELALREGKSTEAAAHLAEVVRLEGAPGRDPLLRAHYRLAALALAAGRGDDARRECDLVLKTSPKHDRARALCATQTVDLGAAAPTPIDAGAPAAAAAPPVAPPVAPKPHDASLAPPVGKEAAPADYRTLVRDADRLSENGRSQQARKLYERALELDPRGVGALTGLGYCDLDAERFLQAVDRFNAALAIDAANGDAMVGLAESYKIRGQTARAIEYYNKYLDAHAAGSRATMAQKNIRELQLKLAKESEAKEGEAKATEKPGAGLPKPPPEEPPP